jgi:hypothetical protein
MPVPVNKLNIAQLTQDHVNKFWVRVNKTNTCWLWTSCTTIHTPMITVGGINQLCSRWAYYFRNKKDPYPYFVLHTCDNVLCVNPNHLFLGTSQDNVTDKIQKGRGVSAKKGFHGGETILTEIEAKEIKHMLSLNIYLQNDIAKYYRVSPSTISRIKKGKAWVHLLIDNP